MMGKEWDTTTMIWFVYQNRKLIIHIPDQLGSNGISAFHLLRLSNVIFTCSRMAIGCAGELRKD